MKVHVAGLPKSAFLSAGRRGTGDRWFLEPEDLQGVELILPPFFTGPLVLEVVAVAREGLHSASDTKSLTIDVVPSFNNALIAQMIQQGDELLRQKDLAAARIYYEEAARRGYAPAMTSMGLTYDPNEYKKQGLSVSAADADLARHWYLRGIAAGDSKAADYLSALGRRSPPSDPNQE